MDNYPISCYHLGEYFQVDGKQLQHQYKEHISGYCRWHQKEHAEDWMLFCDNVGSHLSIDETALSNAGLQDYTLLSLINRQRDVKELLLR